MYTEKGLEKLVGLLNLGKKKQVAKYCNNLVINSGDLASLILAGRVAGVGPYRYACHFLESVPEHLNPKAHELEALGKNGVGPMKKQARKTATKIFQIFEDRRLLSAHLFYTPSKNYWHLFYFDQRDTQGGNNHWKHGPHIHYSQDSFVRESLSEVWAKVQSAPPKLPKSLHIRYDYHHNKK